MAELFNLVSWNIKQFSGKKARKRLPELQDLEVKVWIADLFVKELANVCAVMELTTSTGADAIREVVNALNATAVQLGGSASTYGYVVSGKNASASTSSRADLYGVIFIKSNVTFTFISPPTAPYTLAAASVVSARLGSAVAPTISWTDRAPFCWNVVTSAGTVTVVLWHAPQPAHTMKDKTVAELARLVEAFSKSPYNTGQYVIAGDFNLITSNALSFLPISSLGYQGAFNGQLSTLTTLKSFIHNNRAQFVNDGRYDEAFLAKAYDNIFIRGVTIMNTVRPLVPYWILTQLLDVPLGEEPVSLGTVVPAVSAAALKTALEISDHLPLSVTIATTGTPDSIDPDRLPAYVRVAGEEPEGEVQP